MDLTIAQHQQGEEKDDDLLLLKNEPGRQKRRNSQVDGVFIREPALLLEDNNNNSKSKNHSSITNNNNHTTTIQTNDGNSKRISEPRNAAVNPQIQTTTTMTTDGTDGGGDPTTDDLYHTQTASCLSLFQSSLTPRSMALEHQQNNNVLPFPKQQNHDSSSSSSEEWIKAAAAARRQKDEQQRRQEYQQRLQSFHPVTYFAKPCCLSPIVVARFGWKNVKKDVLQCDACQAVVAIIFNPRLSKHGSDRLIVWYQTQLAETHCMACPFRKPAQRYFLSHHDSHGSPTTTATATLQRHHQQRRSPSSLVMLASVLPPEEVELLEHLHPMPLVRHFVEQLVLWKMNSFPPHPDEKKDDSANENENEDDDIPSHIVEQLLCNSNQSTRNSSRTAADDSSSPPQARKQLLFGALKQMLQDMYTTEPERRRRKEKFPNVKDDDTVWETCLFLTLFGWRPMTVTSSNNVSLLDSSPPILASPLPQQQQDSSSPATPSSSRLLHCPLCLATLAFPKTTTGQERPSKLPFSNPQITMTPTTPKHTTAPTTAVGQLGSTVTAATEPADDISSPTTRNKRPRTGSRRVGPWNAHRYYCPYMCGFPTVLPTTIADNKNTGTTTATITTTDTTTSRSPDPPPVWQELVQKLTPDGSVSTSSVAANHSFPETTTTRRDNRNDNDHDENDDDEPSSPSPWMRIHTMFVQALASKFQT